MPSFSVTFALMLAPVCVTKSCYYRGLNNQNRLPFKGSVKGYHKGSIVGFYDTVALIIRIWFGGHYTIFLIRTPPPKKIVLAKV